ncbi:MULTISPECIES: peptide deformylase [Lawsonibacter]|uniref:Peptide deformylase n=1 Tax=Lawsonibacter hominis TaxID=2763053 RepID=A0A8J6JE15_9FIRM|nr:MULTISPECIES: peptide deformylase [Lawsonibacter]MBS1384580.1 peptide deformylase [Flavonifractor sp.]MDU2196308.1 peptide deformylase [Clostridiales bacterium]MDY2977031.1 peptide deformylase [Oscillospiraceae bacterium]MBC5732630.1 peptide deformylase [Lawsonibacter hominis]MCI6397708.1 peptide deformylase [Lawsonibacter sp.]
MALRTILEDRDPALHKVCRPVTRFDQRLWDLLDDLKETLADANGAGLAAPQVGILRRAVIVVDDQDNMLELVNPEIIDQAGEQEGFEGCLSVPGRWGVVKRPKTVRVRAQDRNGMLFEAEGADMVARCFCHEIEHLDGRLFTEHAPRLYTTEELDQLLEEQAEKERK